jgi:hypothetical protein
MAGCSSGRLSYVVVSQGGVAGVGETLRRLSWTGAMIDGETLVTTVRSAEFQRLEILARDEWPGR